MADAKAGAPADFTMPIGRALPARVLTGSIDGDVVELTIELAHDDWDMADMNMLFHLDWGDRNEGEIVEGGDVRLEMRLAPGLVDQARRLGDDLASAIAGLASDHPLRGTAAWYAMRVTESVPLPPALADKGEVRSGFTTKWNDEPPPS
ncbi:MAG: hypothetical protein RIB65_07995 [Ilumatobacter fluminis]|uniref:hypothetical protein n=1 Tax=Ilumatobacter fluminis TaxID=467091 RepID=UPI0032ED8322